MPVACRKATSPTKLCFVWLTGGTAEGGSSPSWPSNQKVLLQDRAFCLAPSELKPEIVCFAEWRGIFYCLLYTVIH